MFIEASGEVNNLGTLTPRASIGIASATISVSGVSPQAGFNKLYTASRSTPNIGETGNLISVHPNNAGANWASILIGIEPKVASTYINLDFMSANYSGASLADLGSPIVAADGLHISAATILGGPINTMLAATSASIVIELYPIALTPPVNSVLKNGAVELLKVNGFAKISGAGIADASVGFGGFKGVSRIGISYDASSTSICANGGTSQNLGSRPVTASTFALQPGLIVRRIEIWNSKLSPTDLQLQTEIHNKQLIGAPASALVLPVALQTFFDDFNVSSLRHRPAGTTSPIVPWPGTDTAFRQAIVNYYDKVGNWMPRYVHQSDAQGTGISSVNDEYQHYCDYDYPGNYQPFTFANSVLTITARATSSLTTAQQAIIGNRYTGGGAVNTGVKYPYVSGVLITAGKFAQKFGYFEARIKTSQISKVWPAFWLLADAGTWFNEIEYDIMEQVGITGDPGYDAVTAHWDNNATAVFRDIHNPYDMSADFHTYGMLWIPGNVTFYRDGAIMTSINTAGNADSFPCYILLNMAVGGSFPGTPDAATLAGMPTTTQVDYVRVFSTGNSGPVIFNAVGNANGLVSVGAVGAIKPIFNGKGTSTGLSSVSAISSNVTFIFSVVGSSSGVSSVSAVSSIGSFISSAAGAASGVGSAVGTGRNLYTLSSVGAANGLTSAAATSSTGSVTIVARAGTATGKSIVSATGANALADPFTPVNFAGVGLDTGFTFKHVGPHPFLGYSTRYFRQDGNIGGLLQYTNTYSLWFANRAALTTQVLQPNGTTSPGYWYDWGRLCTAEQAGPISRGEILAIGLPADHDRLVYPNLPDGTADPRNLPMWTIKELAQGPNGVGTAFYSQLKTGVARVASAGVTNAIFRIMWEHTGGWYRDRAVAGEGGYWLMVFNHITDAIKSQMPGARACWNMSTYIEFNMAKMKDTIFVSTTDANTINNDGVTTQVAGALGVGVPAGTPVVAGMAVKMDIAAIDNYNSCWPTNTQVNNSMSQAQIDATLLTRWNTQGGVSLTELSGYATQLGVKMAFPEWGTGYDGGGVPKDGNGQALWFNGKAGGDDYFYIGKQYDFMLNLRKNNRLSFFNYWERKASDGYTSLSFSSNVVYRTGKTHTWTSSNPDPNERPLASKAFVERFGIPMPQ